MLSKAILPSLQCQICLSVMKDPRFLPCGHNFCLRCLIKLAHVQVVPDAESPTFQCPNKCNPFPFTAQTIPDLPRNFALANIIDSVNQVGVCETHLDVMSHVDIATGKLFCTACIKEPPTPASAITPAPAPTTPTTATNTEPTSAATSTPTPTPTILPFSDAEPLLTDQLMTLATRYSVLTARMSRHLARWQAMSDAGNAVRERVHQEVDTAFAHLHELLDAHREKLKSEFDLSLGLVPGPAFSLPNTAPILTRLSEHLRATTQRAEELIDARKREQNPYPQARFCKKAARLGATMVRDIAQETRLVLGVPEPRFDPCRESVKVVYEGLEALARAVQTERLCALVKVPKEETEMEETQTLILTRKSPPATQAEIQVQAQTTTPRDGRTVVFDVPSPSDTVALLKQGITEKMAREGLCVDVLTVSCRGRELEDLLTLQEAGVGWNEQIDVKVKVRKREGKRAAEVGEK